MIIAQDDNGQRLDRYLKKAFPTLSYGETQKLIRKGQIRINGKRAKSDSRLNAGDELRLPPSLQNTDSKPKIQFSQKDRDAIEAMIIHEDDCLLVLDKPAGLAVQGGSKTTRHIDGMLNSYIKKNVKPRLTHRLDKDTSGVLILAKTAEAARDLTKQFQNHEIQKTYFALTHPAPSQNDGIIDAKIGKSPARRDGREMMIYDPDNGQKAVTEFDVLDRARKDIAFVAFYPQTGRTHQIRVHAKILGAPLLGDQKYNDVPFPPGSECEIYNGLHLHARSITIHHPISREDITFEAPLPKGFQKSFQYYGFTI